MRENIAKTTFLRAKSAINVLNRHRYTTVAGTLVFFLLMSLVPIVFWLTLLFGKADVQLLGLELFDWSSELITYVQTSAERATAGVNVFFLATTLWSSTGFFYHLRRSGEIVYEYRRANKGWKVRVSAVLLTFGVLVFLAFSGSLLIGVNYLLGDTSPYLAYPVQYSLLFVLSFFAAWLLNGYVCPYRLAPQDTVLGSLWSALAWFAASVAFSFYLNFANPERLYGALSLVIVFLLWLYWMMICFIVGVIFNRTRLDGKKEHKKL